jgi:hypothetical protein
MLWEEVSLNDSDSDSESEILQRAVSLEEKSLEENRLAYGFIMENRLTCG